ncbi:MAG: cysteine--tRNA ligase [Candidatus Aureabacteria bacterium]|nr:cysteine--tRNA ligase [Candidatus Auribacterota bacterium]
MALRIHNTFSGQKEDFVPLHDNKVLMYVCGITAYDDCHLGHARAYTAFDMIYRYLKFAGYDVTYVRNVTDVDDKIINRAGELYPGEHSPDDMKKFCREISEKYYASFVEDMNRLNLARPDKEPWATQHIGEMIKIIKGLVEKDYAYAREGDIYFRISRFQDYGKLSKRSLDEMMAGARVEEDVRKENPYDFALWKSSKANEPGWDSPWGKGRPGWHIECSAMSQKHLGMTLDIHGGGQDLIFPHHENEIAQSEAYTGKPFVKYWIHNGFITINREKMSKSLKNFKTLKELFKKYPARAIKFYLISTHYRSPLDFSDALIESSFEGLRRIENALMIAEKAIPRPFLEKKESRKDDRIMENFTQAMDDDFNSARAVGLLFESVTELLSLLPGNNSSYERIAGLRETILAIMDILGIIYEIRKARKVVFDPSRIISDEDMSVILNKEAIEDPDVEALLQKRFSLKRNKDFKNADKIRSFLLSKDIEVRDVADEIEWSWRK